MVCQQWKISQCCNNKHLPGDETRFHRAQLPLRSDNINKVCLHTHGQQTLQVATLLAIPEVSSCLKRKTTFLVLTHIHWWVERTDESVKTSSSLLHFLSSDGLTENEAVSEMLQFATQWCRSKPALFSIYLITCAVHCTTSDCSALHSATPALPLQPVGQRWNSFS